MSFLTARSDARERIWIATITPERIASTRGCDQFLPRRPGASRRIRVMTCVDRDPPASLASADGEETRTATSDVGAMLVASAAERARTAQRPRGLLVGSEQGLTARALLPLPSSDTTTRPAFVARRVRPTRSLDVSTVASITMDFTPAARSSESSFEPRRRDVDPFTSTAQLPRVDEAGVAPADGARNAAPANANAAAKTFWSAALLMTIQGSAPSRHDRLPSSRE